MTKQIIILIKSTSDLRKTMNKIPIWQELRRELEEAKKVAEQYHQDLERTLQDTADMKVQLAASKEEKDNLNSALESASAAKKVMKSSILHIY